MATPTPSRIPDWFSAILGTVGSVGLAVFFYLRTDLNSALATFAGLIGVMISLQIESMLQTARHNREAERHKELAGRLEQHPWLPSMLSDSLKALEGIHPSIPAHYAEEFATRAFEDCLETLRDLQRGRLRVASTEDVWLVQRLTEQVKHRLVATTVDTQELDWWSEATGQQYVRTQAKGVRRGVDVERIFIYREWTDQHELAVSQQHAVGIQTFRVDRRMLPPRLNLGLVIWDDALALEMEFTSEGEFLAEHITFVDKDISRLSSLYGMIRSIAEPWPPSASSPGDGVRSR
jgi:hypothetical protein